MFGAVYNFFRRNRRKLLAVGIVAGGAVAASHYAVRKFNEWKERQVLEYLEQTKKEQYFENTQVTCNQTIKSMFSKVKEHIHKEIDIGVILSELKKNPKNRVELWEDLKLLTFTRIIVDVYATSLFALLNKVQFAILAGYLFADSKTSSVIEKLQVEDAAVMTATAKIQERYLGTVNHFISNGISLLIKEVLTAVKAEFGPVSLKENVTIMDIQNGFQNVCCTFFRQHETDDCGELLVDILLPKDAVNAYSNMRDDLILAKMLDETLDAFDNSEMFPVLFSVINSNFGLFYDELIPCFESSNGTQKQFLNPNLENRPLAKIIPAISNLIKCDDRRIIDGFLNNSLQFVPLKSYAGNIYDVFSSHHHDKVYNVNHI